MNAPSPSADRDLEALRRAQRAHEPSMEEILASIRSIIAEEKPAPRPPTSGPQIVVTNDPAPSQRPFEAALSEAPGLAGDTGAKIVRMKPEFETAPQDEPAPEPEMRRERAWEADAAPAQSEAEAEVEPLASSQTDAAVAASFDSLSASLALQHNAMIEAAVREMVRPMLKMWLDDNLPSLVERLVKAEIQRVARGR